MSSRIKAHSATKVCSLAGGRVAPPPPLPVGLVQRKTIETASTRTNSPCSSSSAASSSGDSAGRHLASPSKHQAHNRGVPQSSSCPSESLAARRGIRSAVLQDLGIDAASPCSHFGESAPLSPLPATPPVTPHAAASPLAVGAVVHPCPSGSPPCALVANVNSTPISATSPMGLQHRASLADASQRRPGFIGANSPTCADASQRHLGFVGNSSSGSGADCTQRQVPGCIAAISSTPQQQGLLFSGCSRFAMGGDASQRTCPQPAVCVDAPQPLPQQQQQQQSQAPAPAATRSQSSVSTAWTMCCGEEMPASGICAVCRKTVNGCVIPDASERTPISPVLRLGGHSLSADALRSWLAGSRGPSAALPAQELAARLAAAAPEAYED
mmetsp:Transcript_67263/g.219055  ORF Transcript_67263/g.219055 Transcript_67263/m.219055 type:complete len:384 (+) Transcript_67263:60-1211(+)